MNFSPSHFYALNFHYVSRLLVDTCTMMLPFSRISRCRVAIGHSLKMANYQRIVYSACAEICEVVDLSDFANRNSKTNKDTWHRRESLAQGHFPRSKQQGRSDTQVSFDIEDTPVVPVDELRAEVKISLYLAGEIYALNRMDIATLASSKRDVSSTSVHIDSRYKNDPEKLQHVLEIIHHAEGESEGYYGLSNVARKFGRIEEETKSAIRSREWNDRNLEAKHLEYSCKTSLRREFIAPDTSVFALARHGRTARIMSKKLLRSTYEEFDAISAEAVGGIRNFHRDDCINILRSHPMRETVAVFCRFVAKYMMGARNTMYHSLASTFIPNSIENNVYENDTTAYPLSSLKGTLDSLDVIASHVRRLMGMSRSPWIDVTLDNHLLVREMLETSAKPFTQVSPFIHKLAVQGMQWEKLLKYDMPIFCDVDPIVFEVITLATALQRISRLWTKDDVVKKDILGSLKPHLSLLNEVLKAYVPDKIESISAALNTHCEIEDTSALSPQIFAIIELKMDSYGTDIADVDKRRVRLIYYQLTQICCQIPGMGSLDWLITKVSANMMYHLRFKAILPKLNRKQRDRIHLGKTIPLEVLQELEKSCGVTVPTVESVAFLTIMFIHFLTTTSTPRGLAKGINDAPLQRLASASGDMNFTILTLACQKASTDLKIHHPVQFEHKSWMSADDRGIYQMLPSQALMGAMSRQFWRTKPPVLEALDCLSRVGWRFNKFILHVEEMIVLEGYGFHKLTPSFYSVLHMKMADGKVESPSIQDRASKAFLIHRKTRKLYTDQSKLDTYFERGLFANRRLIIYALRIARSLINKLHFFIPHKLDFRGRMYSLPGHVNPGGSDPHRALLDFSESKPLGVHGFYWLKIHLANVMGYSKLSFDERIQYIDDHMDDIVQSAESPLTGDRWWQQGSEPIQALRACKEVHDAMSHSQGIQHFESRLPVQIDGTCNGLQHYSAIARDEIGGLQVNLVPTNRPQDVYTGVLRAMMTLVHEDASNDHAVALRCVGSGKDLDRNHVTRKTIKQAVMTQVYGVTDYGMRAMILKELEVQNHAHQLWSKSMISDMALYLCEKLMLALGITFRKAGKCRQWLNEIVETIWRCQPDASKQCFQWMTPLGLIIRQPYTKGIMTNIYTSEGTIRIECSQVNHASLNQLSAFAPNLIHSLDACHLSMTALEMDRVGLKFAAVHDSFWTHACDLPVLSRILRQEFANLYKNFDPLWELKEQLEEQFYMDLLRHGVKLRDPPSKGSLDLDEIMKSKYFFA